jgi:hypothetical protein
MYVCLCVKIRKGSRYFHILDSYIEDRFLISEPRVLSRGSLCGICCRQVFVAVMFLSEYHWSCPSTTDFIREHPILSEYHGSCPSTYLVRVPLFLSEYIWSCPSTIVLALVPLFLSEYHCYCPSTTVLVRVPRILSEYIISCPSATVLVRVHLILSEYHCSCPSTTVTVRLPLLLSEYHCSFPSTAVLVSFFVPPVLHIQLPSTVIDAASVSKPMKKQGV